MSVKLSITNRTRGKVELRWLQRQLHRTLEQLKIARGEWSVTIVGDRAMAELHKRTMKLPTTTDVLTFNLAGGDELELDTVICRDEAMRQARQLGHSVREELLLYCIHSLLHVRGYDDVTAAKAARMHRREDEILLTLGIGAVYAGAGKAAVSAMSRRRKKSS